jgi:hypothetical protein
MFQPSGSDLAIAFLAKLESSQIRTDTGIVRTFK